MSKKRFMVLAGVLVLGIAVSVVFGRLLRPFASTGFREMAKPLAEFPREILDFRGEDRPLGEHAQKVAAVDRYLRREYVSSRGERVLLYIAYYGNRRRGLETIFHNPTVCYPAAGYEQGESEIVPIAPAGRTEPFEASLDIFRQPRGGDEVVVVNFFVVDEKKVLSRPPRNDVLALGVEKLRPSLSAGYFAQVQVSCSARPGVAAARDASLRFLAAAADAVFDHL